MHLDVEFLQVVGQVFGHALGQRRHQHALAILNALSNLSDQIIHLPLHGFDLHFGIDQAGRADDLLHNLLRMFQFIRGGCGRGEDHLPNALLELLKHQRPIVDGAGQAETVLDQFFLAIAIAVMHGAHLRQRHVALVDDEQEIVGEVIDQRPRGFTRRSAVEVPRVVFDAGTVAHFAQHFQIVLGALLDALRFEVHLVFFEVLQSFGQFGFDLGHGALHLLFRGDELLGRINLDSGVLGQDLAGQAAESRSTARSCRPRTRCDTPSRHTPAALPACRRARETCRAQTRCRCARTANQPDAAARDRGGALSPVVSLMTTLPQSCGLPMP